MKSRISAIVFFLYSILYSYDISIEIITTNDLHGNIAPQKAWFMNPGFPPDISGGAVVTTKAFFGYSASEIASLPN